MANKYSKEMTKITEQGKTFANKVLSSLAPQTVKESFEIINNKGHEQEKKAISSIEIKYNSGDDISADELIRLNDIFIAVTKRIENNGVDYNE